MTHPPLTDSLHTLGTLLRDAALGAKTLDDALVLARLMHNLATGLSAAQALLLHLPKRIWRHLSLGARRDVLRRLRMAPLPQDSLRTLKRRAILG